MRAYASKQLSDEVIAHTLDTLVTDDCTHTAELLTYIAEFDERRLYLPAGFPSMHAYCVERLHMSEDIAYKRRRAARAARQFPSILDAVAAGRLHLAAVCLLEPHLTRENADDLLVAATHKSKSEVMWLVAQRFPRTELLTLVEVVPASSAARHGQLAPGPVDPEETERVAVNSDQPAPGRVGTPVSRPSIMPLAPERFALHFTIDQVTHDKLRHVQALLSHRLPSGDVAQVFDRALNALMEQLEKQKYAATTKPRARSRATTNKRCIPARVKRAVWARDQGQCAFVSASGQRCSSRRFLQFDARRAVEFCATLADATLEERVRAALRFLCPRTRVRGPVATGSART